MSLWVDKHRPKSIENLDINNELTCRLKSLSKCNNLPHLLVYGPSGSGKKTRVMTFICSLFGPGAERIKIDSQVYAVSSSKKLEFTTVSSIYHIEITPADMGQFYDRLIIQDLLKDIAQSSQIDINAKHKFKVVIIHDADSLSRDAQAALRRTMEKYSSTLRLILIATSTCNIISPIRSRTLQIRVPAPNFNDISNVLNSIAKKEHLNPSPLPDIFLKNIINLSERNLRRAILILEAASVAAPSSLITDNTPVIATDWQLMISSIASDIISSRTASMILKIRAKFYDLISHCIPPKVIITTLAMDLFNSSNLSVSVRENIIYWASHYEYRIHIGSKAIFHLEAFVAKVMKEIETHDT